MSLKYPVLVALSVEASTGYDLNKRFKESIGFFVKSTHQQIYRELAKLLDKGLVEIRMISQKERPDKKIYSLSSKGRKDLKRWVESPTEMTKSNDPFLVKVFGGHVVGKKTIVDQINAQMNKHQAQLAIYKEIRSRYFANPKQLLKNYQFQYLALLRGIHYSNMWINWAKDSIRFLEE